MRELKEVISCKGTRFEKLEGVEFNEENWKELKSKGILGIEDMELADDWYTTFPPKEWGIKFSKLMYSKSLDRLRHATFSEFYGEGIVD